MRKIKVSRAGGLLFALSIIISVLVPVVNVGGVRADAVSGLTIPCGTSIHSTTGSTIQSMRISKECMTISIVDRSRVDILFPKDGEKFVLDAGSNDSKFKLLGGYLDRDNFRVEAYFDANGTKSQIGTLIPDGANYIFDDDLHNRWDAWTSDQIKAFFVNLRLVADNDRDFGGLNLCENGDSSDDYAGLEIKGDKVTWDCHDSIDKFSVFTNIGNNLIGELSNFNITHVASSDRDTLTSIYDENDVELDSFVYCEARKVYALKDCNDPRDGYIIEESSNKFDTDQSVLVKAKSTKGKKDINMRIAGSKSAQSESSGTTEPATADSVSQEDGDSCFANNDSALAWVFCPLIELMTKSIRALDSGIIELLSTKANETFDEEGDGKEYYIMWSAFRYIALSLLVIIALVMIFSQAIGGAIFDAYSIKKILPRMVVAVIFVSISWPLLKFFMNFVDSAGLSVRAIIFAPFGGFEGVQSDFESSFSSLDGAVLVGAFAIGLAASIPAFLLLGVTALAALFTGFFVVVLREIVIILLMVTAPIAIIAYILPNTEKVWKIWQESFSKALLMFPLIMALIAIGQVFSVATIKSGGGLPRQIVAFIAYFAPYFILPKTLSFAGGILSTLGGGLNDRSKGVFDRLKNARAELRKDLHGQRMADKKMKGPIGNAYRRAGNLGKNGSWSPTSRGRAKYLDYQQRLQKANAAEALKNDDGHVAGDDNATAAALHATSARDFLNRYQSRVEAAERQKFIKDNGRDWNADEMASERARISRNATTALASLENGFGAKMGSKAMRASAYAAKTSSVTGYTGDDNGLKEMILDSRQLVKDGVISATDGMLAVKANQKRADQSGIGAADLITQFGKTDDASMSGSDLTDDAIRVLRDSALEGSGPGQIVAFRKEAVKALAPTMVKRVREKMQAVSEAQAGTPEHEKAQQALQRELATIAGRYDAMSQIAPANAEIMAEDVMGQDMGGRTIQQMIEDARQTQGFVEMRREYAQGQLGAAQNAQNLAAMQAAQGQQPGQVPPPGGPYYG